MRTDQWNLETLTLRSACYVNSGDLREVSNCDNIAGLVLRSILNADLAEVTHWLDALCLEVTSHWLVDMLLRDVAEANLYGIVAVRLNSLYL